MITVENAPAILRIGRATKYIPGFRGMNALLALYERGFPTHRYFEIDDFDDDLRLVAKLPDGIGVNLWHNPKKYERDERKLFASAIKAGDLVLDIGANIGLYSLMAAKRGARVESFEPDPGNVELLLHHIRINGLKANIHACAAGSQEGELTLGRNPRNIGGTGKFAEENLFTVHVITVDSLKVADVAVCKIDVEGSESEVVAGMQQTIAASPRMKLLVEYSEWFGHRDNRPNAHKLFDDLKSKFSAITVVGGRTLKEGERPPAFCNLWCERQ